MDTIDEKELKMARVTPAEPVDRGRVVIEILLADTGGVRHVKDERPMGWLPGDEYVEAFGAAGLASKHKFPGLIGRGLYIAVADGDWTRGGVWRAQSGLSTASTPYA